MTRENAGAKMILSGIVGISQKHKEKCMEKKQEANAAALLPIGVFLVLFLGSGFITGDFYSMPAIVGFLLALLVAFVQDRQHTFDEKIHRIAQGVGDDNIITMCLIFLVAGGFSGAVTAAGGAESAVNFGLSILPSGVAVVGIFLIGCFISVSMGTSMGTIAALAPIAVEISNKTGFSMAVCAGAVVGGAMFGDNLSMISDTTIAAVKTQGCEMKDKFKENFLIVLPAALVTLVIFFLLTRDGSFQMTEELPYNIWKILPYLVVLVGALIGFNVFLVLIAGTVLSLVVGVALGTIPLSDIFQVVAQGADGTGGIMGMYDITVISIVVACIVSFTKEMGGIQFLLEFIRKRIRGKKGGELGIAVLSLLVDMCTANNTVAIVMAGSIAREISEEYEISPRRSASLLDMYTSVGQGLIPYGAQLLSAASLMGLTPYQIIPYCFYPILMAISGIVFILFVKNRKATD